MLEYLIIGLIAFFTSIVSGLLGLGGAALLIPLYLYVPRLFGAETLDIKLITGMTSVQVFVSSFVGMLLHKQKKSVNSKLVYTMGLPIVPASFTGAALSAYVSPLVILAVFAVMAVSGAALMTIRREEKVNENGNINFNAPLAGTISLIVGFFGGIAGAPGAFILSPVMMTILKIPTRITIGSTLGIVLLSAGSASAGKFITGQVPFEMTLVAAAATLPGVWLGSYFSHQVKARTLRIALAFLIAAVGFEMWYQIIFN